MGLLSGRSRPSSRRTRSEGDSRISSRYRRPDVDEEVVEVKKPDVEELRQRRAEYYSVPPADRRRASASVVSREPSGRSSSSALRSSDKSRERHRRKHGRSNSDKSAKRSSASRTRTEDYVYGPPPSTQRSGLPAEDRSRVERRSARSVDVRPRHPTLSRRQSLPTVIESDVMPDDSISQVGERAATEVSQGPSRMKVRPSLRRSNTTSSKLAPIPESAKDNTSVAPSRSSTQTGSVSRASSVRRHSTTAVPSPPQLVECLTCGSDDVPVLQSAKLACSHRMCHDCLKRIFEMSVKDPVHMPPKCCTDQHIPLKHVDKLFDTKFKILWNRKYQEYHTKNRIYCPTLKCGEWIKPAHIHTSQGRKYAQCPRCRTKVCTLCNNKMHKSTDCPKDPEIAKLVEQAKTEGWQRCYSCSAFVERREGCNHMTCRCLAEFCILCGSKWKTCECPWFNYANLPEQDRLNDMRVPEPIRYFMREMLGGVAANGAIPRPPMDDAAPVAEPGTGLVPARGGRRGPLPEVTYQQELDQRRQQEQLDEDFARRLQLASLVEPGDERNALRRADAIPAGLGNLAGHFLNDEFVQNAANVVMNAFGDANLGRRGERPSGRRRRARPSRRDEDEPDLAPSPLGDEGVLEAGPAGRE